MAYIGNGPGVASQRILTTLTAVDGQTTFVPSAGYTLGYVDVFLNGVKLIDGTDYTAANGVNIVLTEAAALNDTVEVVTYFPRGLSDGYTKAEADSRYEPIDSAYTKAEADARYVEVSGDTMTGNLTVPMVVTSSALSNRNMIINGEFLVWQRSDNAYTSGRAYVSADRFATTRGRIRKPNTNGNTGEDNRGAVFDTTDNNIYVHFDYAVEDVGQKLHGKTMTFSFYAKVLSGGTTLLLQDAGGDHLDFGNDRYITLTSNWERYTVTGTIVSTGSSFGIAMPRLYLNPTGGADPRMIQVDQFQLEEGDTATPFEHRSFGDEMARCQRYYYQRDYTINTYEPIKFPCWSGSTSTLVGEWKLPVTMRASPTVTNNGVGNFRLNDSRGNDQICTSINITGSNIYEVWLTLGGANASFTVGYSGYINTQQANDAALYFDAEL